MSSTIVLSVDIATTPDKAYEALSTQRGLAGWYTPEVETEQQQHSGSMVTLRFGELTMLIFKIEELETNRRLVWSGVQVPGAWKQSRITFEIAGGRHTTADSSMATLQFTQSGLPSAYEDLGIFSYLWGQYLRSIKLLLETGTGEPFGSAGSKLAGTTPPNA